MTILDDLKMQYKLGGIAQKMIYWNIGFFLISLIFFYQFKFSTFSFPNWIALYSNPKICFTHPWTLISYGFVHYNFIHLFFNMMVLNFSSKLFLTFFTTKQYFGLYILSLIFSGLIFVLISYIYNQEFILIGASGAIMAILVATTTYQPLMNINLLFIGNVKLWHVTGIILLLNLIDLNDNNFGGHIAHLSGAFFGYLFIKLLLNGTDLSKITDKSIYFFTNLFYKKQNTPFKKVHVNYNTKTTKKPLSQIINKDKTQQQIDDILDKISQSGYDSLSAEEKEFLFKAGKK